MNTPIFTTAIIFLFSSTAWAQKAIDLNVDFMVGGHIYAKSSIEDTTAFGGFGGSSNSPKVINAKLVFPAGRLVLKVDPTQMATIDKTYNGYKLYLANTTSNIVRLAASDSRLNVIAEVFYKRQWQPIEYLPSSSCGNSYHHVYLKQNEYWEFDVPKFKGKTKTKLRYKLILDKDNYILSNEISASFNRKQLEATQTDREMAR